MRHDKRIQFLKRHNRFLITTHINSDGDALAAVLAASMLLEKLDKEWRIIIHDTFIDPRYSFLKNWDKIIPVKTHEENVEFDAALVLDAPGRMRIGDVNALIGEKLPALKIDHHPSEDDFEDSDYVVEDASSASALLYELVDECGIEIDKDLAEALYTGIVYDTGRLSYSNTTSEDLRICARLIDCGVEPAKITRQVFLNHRTDVLRVVGRGLQSVRRYLNDKVGVIVLLNDEIRGVEQGEIEELANYTVALAGVEVGAYIREVEPGFFKISLRSRDTVNVRKIAQSFKGGGHYHASGCRYSGSYDTLLSKLLSEISEELKKLS